MFCGGAYKALAFALACLALLCAFAVPCLAEEKTDLIEESTEVENVDEKQETTKEDETVSEDVDQAPQEAIEEVPSTVDRSSGRDLAVGLSSPMLGATAANTLTSGDLTNIQTQVWAKAAPNWVWSSGSNVDMLRFLTYWGNINWTSGGGNTQSMPSLYQSAYEARLHAQNSAVDASHAAYYSEQNATNLATLQTDVTSVKGDLETVKGDVALIKTTVAQGGTSGSVTINTEQMDKFVSALKTLNTQTLLLLVMLSTVGGLLAWRIVSERWRHG